ncbi:hypothetical protein [Paenibacillus harenae]|uniref:hypothetical protein n=1 Tax=Paenibacillus harenae TaxID=306543 RepID=UPI0003FA9640|nr:hypothetical protein [Paenibacillus harenae]
MKLSFEKFEAAKNYLMKNGRDLEQELFRFHFEKGSSQALLRVLSNYQGEDGGFKNMGEGHPIYTNAMDTSMAFQYLSEVGATSRDEIVQKGIQYIVDSYDCSLKCWHPRPNETSSRWGDNPGAELVGFLFEYRDLVPNDFLEAVTETPLSSIRNPKKTYDQFYFLKALCFLRLAARVVEPYKTEILDWLKADIFEIIETDQSKWATIYSAKPFFFAHSPQSPLYETIKHQVIRSLENEIITQSEEGNFVLNWNTDAESQRIWKSIWTMDVLRALHHHAMIEG